MESSGIEEEELRPQLGNMLTDMLITMTDRGPDGAGIAIPMANKTEGLKLTVVGYAQRRFRRARWRARSRA